MNRRDDGYVRNIVERIGQLEEAYSLLPGRARTPQMQRLWILACLREVELLCESCAHRRGFAYRGMTEDPDERAFTLVKKRPRFYRALMSALWEVDAGGHPILFMTAAKAANSPHDQVAPASQRDKGRKWVQARAAAILHVAERYSCHDAKEWAQMIAAALSLAGMPGAKRGRRKSSLELTGSAVSKWLDACMSDDHPFAELFDRSAKTIATKEFLAGGPDERDDVLRYKIIELCDVVALHYGDRRDADAEPRIVYFYRLATGLQLTNEARGNLGLEFP